MHKRLLQILRTASSSSLGAMGNTVLLCGLAAGTTWLSIRTLALALSRLRGRNDRELQWQVELNELRVELGASRQREAAAGEAALEQRTEAGRQQQRAEVAEEQAARYLQRAGAAETEALALAAELDRSRDREESWRKRAEDNLVRRHSEASHTHESDDSRAAAPGKALMG